MEKKAIFSLKVDKLSQNIIYLLSLNSRTTISEISKILHKSRKIVENRYNKLFENNLISPLLVYNVDKRVKATILIELSTMDRAAINAINDFKRIVKLKETLGSYDFSILVAYSSDFELNKILNKINLKFKNKIKNIDVLVHDFEDTLGYKSFCNDISLISRYVFNKPTQKKIISTTEDKILDEIITKPDASYVDMIKKTNLSYKQIKRAIDNLINSHMIRFTIDPDYNKLGLEFHNILIRINKVKQKEFEKNIIKNSRVHWIKRSSGRWDYILSVTSRNISDFIQITHQIREKNSKYIFDFSFLISKINITRQY